MRRKFLPNFRQKFSPITNCLIFIYLTIPYEFFNIGLIFIIRAENSFCRPSSKLDMTLPKIGVRDTEFVCVKKRFLYQLHLIMFFYSRFLHDGDDDGDGDDVKELKLTSADINQQKIGTWVQQYTLARRCCRHC